MITLQLRRMILLLSAVTLLGCGATARAPAPADRRGETTTERTAQIALAGGLGGVARSVRIWSTGQKLAGEFRDERRQLRASLHQDRQTLQSALDRLLELAAASPDTASQENIMCTDLVITRLTVRDGERRFTATDGRCRLSSAETRYWREVDSIYQSLTMHAGRGR